MALLLVNLLAAHAVRFKLTPRRFGVLVLHFGLILLLGSELATAALAQESQMKIDEGSYANYTEDMRAYELAVIDTTPKDHNNVTVIPGSILKAHLRSEAPITHPDLPFEVEVHQWMENSELFAVAPHAASSQINLADTGLGNSYIARPHASSTGTDVRQKYNTPSAYITLRKDGKSLGSYLVTTWDEHAPSLLQTQPVKVEGKTYQIDLRDKRTYRPYTMHLIDFQHKTFTGTDMAKSFVSKIRLVDPRFHEDRQVLISMNNPLRYNGTTFYQSSFKPDNSGTVLQVVENPAWVLPYVSCTLIALGLVIHFGMHLYRFLRRQFA